MCRAIAHRLSAARGCVSPASSSGRELEGALHGLLSQASCVDGRTAVKPSVPSATPTPDANRRADLGVGPSRKWGREDDDRRRESAYDKTNCQSDAHQDPAVRTIAFRQRLRDRVSDALGIVGASDKYDRLS